jgi:hypothetical protein
MVNFKLLLPEDFLSDKLLASECGEQSKWDDAEMLRWH